MILLRLFELLWGGEARPKVVSQQEIKARAALDSRDSSGYHLIRWNVEINTLGYPKAALFGFCLALVAYNMLAVVMAALRSVHGETIDQDLSLYYVANDIAQTYQGMMIAIPEDAWRDFSRMRPAEMVATLRALAQKVRLKAYRKNPQGPKKPRPKREKITKTPHVSTAKLLKKRQVSAVAN